MVAGENGNVITDAAGRVADTELGRAVGGAGGEEASGGERGLEDELDGFVVEGVVTGAVVQRGGTESGKLVEGEGVEEVGEPAGRDESLVGCCGDGGDVY